MKKMNNKGQGAMEYLMTYGWAILVVMIVGVVLWQLGVFNPGTGQATVVGFYKIKPLNTGDVMMKADGNFTAVFINAAGTAISINNIELNITNPTVTPITCVGNLIGTPGQAAVDPAVTPVSVGQGGTFTVESNCPALTGTTYSSTLSVIYTTEVGGFTRAGTEVGTITGPIV